jgi:hypothetical protein
MGQLQYMMPTFIFVCLALSGTTENSHTRFFVDAEFCLVVDQDLNGKFVKES